MRFFNKADAPRPSQRQSFSTTFSISRSKDFPSVYLFFSSIIFEFWYSLDAVQIGLSVNSLFEERNFLKHGLPVIFFSILNFLCYSELLFLKLLKGTPSGEA